jgi:GNAT superfamily N-acetyltransferase
MVLTGKSRLLATLTLLTKQIEHAGARYTVSGLSAVVTEPDHRGSGYGHRLISAAHEQLAGSGADLALFTCDRRLREFYLRAGWTLLAGTVLIGGTVEEPFPSDQFDKVCLGALFSARAIAARASFRGSRIELLPGDIDRLW